MKIRNGFVSNSSSSSFVILGIKVNKAWEEIIAKGEDHPYDVFMKMVQHTDLSYLSDDGPGYLGFVLKDNDEEINNLELSLDDIKNKIEDIKEFLEINGIEGDIKLFIGERSC